MSIPEFNQGLQHIGLWFGRIRKIARDAAIGLVVVLIVAGLQFQGVINMSLGYVCIALAWIIASASIWSHRNKKLTKTAWIAGLGFVFFGGDWFLVSSTRSELEKALCPHPLSFHVKERDDYSAEVRINNGWFSKPTSSLTVFTQRMPQGVCEISKNGHNNSPRLAANCNDGIHQ